MIESLSIEDLGIIESAELRFGPGLTALTGETGAGKTMVLTSLGLLLGQRAGASVVRTGARRALVEGVFLTDPDSPAGRRAAEAGAELDDDLLIATRAVPAEGRSRAHLGGRSVPSSVLAEVGSRLVAVHGQADQLRLRSAAAQRAALDSLGGSEHAALCRRYAHAYRQRARAAEELAQWRAGAQARAEEAARLRAWLEAIEAAAPAPGEDSALEAEAGRLEHAEDLRLAATAAAAALTADADPAAGGSEAVDVASLIAAAGRALAGVDGLDPALTELAARVRQLGILSADIGADLGSYLSGLDADPARLAWVNQRRAELTRLCRETGGAAEQIDGVDALLKWGRGAADRLARIDGPSDGAEELRQALTEAQAELEATAAELSAARAGLAERLQESVTVELEGLRMSGARLVVGLEALDEPGPTGAESVSLLLSPHPGATPMPLGKGASGGELSRIMLALEVVLADATMTEPALGAQDGGAAPDREHARTFVFDEIDAGVGGKAAREIGRRLARLARGHQVIVVTHLAQVAAWADTHLVVHKETPAGGGAPDGADHPGDARITRTRVTRVSGGERERELARMLSGHDDSEAALRHAAELLAEASMAESSA
ncbi:DNA repair protein RecN [Actinomyces gaoshouyii]|uniref:DNA repair protein RecN n=1 Tax=Actinomyces gaoshouyii TaxID=1960083 RepID=UPI0009BEA287|nr:DNA repair protein RecN [Actinomyces gaoshouyii]ARD41554.1 DNA repair protein RecN [Actinomyces gaoshouyii]